MLLRRPPAIHFLANLLADRIDGDQILISLQGLFRQGQLRLLLIELRPETVDTGFVGLHLRLVDARVNFGKQLTLRDRVADIDVNRLDLARHLSTDVHVLLRFQFALRGDNFLDSALNDGYGAK